MENNSILISIKKMLGIEADYEAFDTDIIININTALMNLTQIGVGPKEGFSISNKDNTWKELLEDSKKIEAVKTYIYLKVKIIFDPPNNSAVLESMNRQITELEWRLNVQVDK